MAYLTEIIIAILALAGSALGSYSGFRLTAYRVELLEKTVEKHNNFARRMPVVEEQIHMLNERLDNLENWMENRLDIRTDRKGGM